MMVLWSGRVLTETFSQQCDKQLRWLPMRRHRMLVNTLEEWLLNRSLKCPIVTNKVVQSDVWQGSLCLNSALDLLFFKWKNAYCTVYWQWSESWRMLYVFHATWLPSRLQDSVKKGTMDQFSLNRNELLKVLALCGAWNLDFSLGSLSQSQLVKLG